MTINPTKIPDGAVLFIIEDSSPEHGVSAQISLTRDPAPTCVEPTVYK